MSREDLVEVQEQEDIEIEGPEDLSVNENIDVIEDEEGNLLSGEAAPESPEQMIDTINTLLENNETQEKLAKNAFEFINTNFSWDVLIDKYKNLYKS